MEGIMRDDELFMSTQSQGDVLEGDDVYLSLAKAITERECRTLQKKENLRLIIDERRKRNQELKSDKKKKKHLKEELEGVNNQKNIQIRNLTDVQGSRATLETMLCDLNNKVSLEKAETKRKKGEYDAALSDAVETWESYKGQYANFPLAKKFQAAVIEEQKLSIKCKQVMADITDFKTKKILKDEISEKAFHVSIVKLAKSYFVLHNKNQEKEKFQAKMREMSTLITDIKSGKKTNKQLGSFKDVARPGSSKEQSMVWSPTGICQFEIPELQINSPISAANGNESGGSKNFDWNYLFSSTGSSSSFKKHTEKSLKSVENKFSKQEPASNITSKALLESKKKKEDKVPYNVKKTTSSLKLTNLVKYTTNFSPLQRKYIGVVKKRNYADESNSEVEKPTVSKKVCKVQTQPNTLGADVELSLTSNKAIKENPVLSITKKDKVNENLLNKGAKENVDPETNNISSDAKLLMSSLSGNNKSKPTMTTQLTMTQNLLNTLSIKETTTQNKPSDSQKKVVAHDPAKVIQMSSTNYQNLQQYDQQNNEQDVFQNYNIENQNRPLEDIQLLMEPSSPAPDLIPVENNSQPLSEGNIQQAFYPSGNLSGGSEFMSPSDLDEASKLVYQRLAAEMPNTFDYKGVNTMKPQKPATEQDNVVRSHYFSDYLSPDSQTLIKHNDLAGFQSPPHSALDNSQLISSPVLSPPPAAFGGSAPTPSKPNEGFSFSFGEAPKNKSSIFNLF